VNRHRGLTYAASNELLVAPLRVREELASVKMPGVGGPAQCAERRVAS